MTMDKKYRAGNNALHWKFPLRATCAILCLERLSIGAPSLLRGTICKRYTASACPNLRTLQHEMSLNAGRVSNMK